MQPLNPSNKPTSTEILDQHNATNRVITCLCLLLGGGLLGQLLSIVVVRIASSDIQAGGMLADIITQHFANVILGIAFVVLSISNLLIKRGLVEYKRLRLPAIVLAISTAIVAFILIPRMDYLREAALLDGLPVLYSASAAYFTTLSALATSLLLIQLASGGVLVWRQLNPKKSAG
ncbi:DUF4149 domain-containing protein [Polynucleobacter sp.]|uniref:DUF4149 domain-containing protein n=1 Tax=Polynucleobacter sp. TaxID=2029855 RepID=UPI002736D275|nr:DUF4149 domain-containing protein [Polynucleobacter sp.]MDP3122353.1 DUF4149 domain-containing protein [Polynucleobacter sp.]